MFNTRVQEYLTYTIVAAMCIVYLRSVRITSTIGDGFIPCARAYPLYIIVIIPFEHSVQNLNACFDVFNSVKAVGIKKEINAECFAPLRVDLRDP